MTFFGWEFDYVASHEKVSRRLIDQSRSLLVLSDYPAQQFDVDLQQLVIRQIDQGMGLLMIGGWESFHGLGGDWDAAPLAQVLPVEISACDDRINFDQPALLHPTDWTRPLWDLPWSTRPPTVGGLNRFRSRPGCDVLLSVTSYRPSYDNQSASIKWTDSGLSFPGLVTSERHKGRTAAFASDVAPHWVGGFVDWGPSRVTAQAAGAGAIEVGSDYALFWRRLLSWTGRLE
jgi:uncharacterized membrane protein